MDAYLLIRRSKQMAGLLIAPTAIYDLVVILDYFCQWKPKNGKDNIASVCCLMITVENTLIEICTHTVKLLFATNRLQ